MFGLRLGGMGLIPRRSGASGPANSATDWYFSQFGLAGTRWADVSRTGLGTRVDSAGLVGFGPHNLLLHSNNFANAAWDKGTGGSIAGGVTDPNGGTSASAYTWPSTTGSYAFLSQTVSSTSNLTHTQSIWLRRPAGSGSRCLRLVISDVTVSSANSANVIVTEEWQQFSFSRASTNSTGSVGFGLLNASGVPPAPGIAAGEVVHVFKAAGAVGPVTFDIPTTTAARYLPRITHDPVTLSALGLLVEGQATNFISTNFANWTTLAATRNLNAAVAPDGTTTAMHLVETAVTQVHRAEYSLTPSATGAHVSWCYVKAGARSRVYLQNDFGSHNSTAEFNLATGTVVQVTGAGGTPGIRPFNNGWFLIWFSTTPTTTNAGQVRLYIGNSTSNQSYAGDGTSGLYYWGPNTTQGTVPTSDIPNPGTGSALRVADDWFLSGAAFSNAIDTAASNTLVVHFRWYGADPVGGVFAINDGTSSNRIEFRAGQQYFAANVGGVNRDFGGQGAPIIGLNKVAISWGPSGAVACLNGGAVVSNANSFAMAGLSRLYLGMITGAVFQLNGQIDRAHTYRGQYITGAALQALTA